MDAVFRRSVTDARLLLARLLFHVSPVLTLALIAATVLGVLLGTVITLASGALVGSVPAALDAGVDSPAGARLVRALVAVVGGFLLVQVLDLGTDLLTATLGRAVDGHLKARVMQAVLAPAGIAHLEDPAQLDLLSHARGVALGQYPPSMAVRGLFNVLLKGIQAITSAVLIGWYFRWWLALALLAILVVSRTVARRNVLRAVEAAMGATPVLRRADYFLDLALAPAPAKETRVFGLSGWVVDRFRTEWLRAMERVWAERRTAMRAYAPWVIGLVAGSVFAALGLAGWSAARGELGLAALAIVAQSVITLTTYLFSINLPELWLEHGAVAVTAVLELERSLAVPETGGGGDAAARPTDAIRFERVTFRYPGTTTDVYRDLDLVIPAGRSLAIVGANGAGKTTLIKLLTRLYDPTAGRITVDGQDVQQFDMASWRRRIAAIFQDFVRYELTVAENVGFGAVQQRGNRAALEQAAMRAGANDLIDRLPLGWETVLSRQYVDGVELSGGQWQRIALARALFAVEAGAGVLVLDEPTASLDVRAEAALFDRFLELTHGLTTILISHRFSTVRRADVIVVLEAGRVVERGSHDELLHAGGTYARLFRLQAARFGEATQDA